MIATVQDYRRITRDFDSYDGDVIESLVSAQQFVEERTNRFFELNDADDVPIERTESLKIHADGRVYPHATPVVSVLLPANATFANSAVSSYPLALDVAVNGYSYLSLERDWLDIPGARGGPWFGPVGQHPRLLVTYTGGYTAVQMPESVKRLVSEVARASLQRIPTQVPAGANWLRVGDVQVRGTALGADLPATVWSGIRTWKRREL